MVFRERHHLPKSILQMAIRSFSFWIAIYLKRWSRAREKIDSSRLLLLKTLFPANVSKVINSVLYASITSKVDLRDLLALALKTLDVLQDNDERHSCSSAEPQLRGSLNGGRRPSRLILNDRTSSHCHHPRYRLLHSSIPFSRHSWLAAPVVGRVSRESTGHRESMQQQGIPFRCCVRYRTRCVGRPSGVKVKEEQF